jgi:predicted polyphosphate/ATP-dependent NAD kinase
VIVSAFPTIGLVINPIAGMGGRVGLKGTDGLSARARALGAEPAAGQRAISALAPLAGSKIRFVTAGREMGGDSLDAAGVSEYECLYHPPVLSTAEDTRAACRAFLDEGVDLVLFCGGDGTARDVADTVGTEVPLLGIPAGVKMYSSVFAVAPGAIARILQPEGKPRIVDAEVIDVDEAAYRSNVLRTRLYAVVKTPAVPGLVQTTKQVFEEYDEARAKTAIGAFIADAMLPDVLYLIGPGTTTGAVMERLGLAGTLLGFDAVLDGHLVASDLNETELLSVLEGAQDVRLVLSVIGAQGFVLGRGTQVCSSTILSRIGKERVIVVGTPGKLERTPILYVETGDPALDRSFGPTIQVITGYGIAQRKRVNPIALYRTNVIG